MDKEKHAKLIPSTFVFKKYKHYSTYKGKVVVADSTHIYSVVVDIERLNKEDALKDAEAKADEMIEQNKL